MNEARHSPTLTLEAAAEVLRHGGLIAYPTETVYGLGCRWDAPETVRRLIDIKRRETGKGLILIGANRAQLAPLLAPLDDCAWQKILTPTPRPTTWVATAASGLDPLLTGARSTLAIRVTSDPIARALCLAVGCALVSTSANLSGEPPARRPNELAAALLAHLDGVLEGECAPDARPSRIVDLRTGAVLRD